MFSSLLGSLTLLEWKQVIFHRFAMLISHFIPQTLICVSGRRGVRVAKRAAGSGLIKTPPEDADWESEPICLS